MFHFVTLPRGSVTKIQHGDISRGTMGLLQSLNLENYRGPLPEPYSGFILESEPMDGGSFVSLLATKDLDPALASRLGPNTWPMPLATVTMCPASGDSAGAWKRVEHYYFAAAKAWIQLGVDADNAQMDEPVGPWAAQILWPTLGLFSPAQSAFVEEFNLCLAASIIRGN